MMSRLRVLKEKRKNIIKATSCGLALTLMMGLAQGLGTYALFTDTEDIASELAISTGDVDVEITKGAEGFDVTDLQPGDTITYPFTITNQGTLRQNLTLQLDTSKIPSELKDIIPYINYNIKFEDGTYISGLQNGNTQNIINKDGSLLVLNPGESIKLIAEVVLSEDMHHETQVKLQNKIIPLHFKIRANQINETGTLMNIGFFDVCTQENDLMIGALILEEEKGIKITPANDIDNAKDVFIEFYTNNNKYMTLGSIVDILDGDLLVKLSNENVTSRAQSGAFKDAQFTINNNGIKLFEPILGEIIEEEFNKGHHIDIQVDYGNSVYRVYRIDFRGIPTGDTAGNRLAQAQISDVTNKYLTEVKEEAPKEEVEIPTDPEVVEPPKEEVEVPTDPEVVEPPKEEVEAPTEPEVVEPPKEEVEIPTEPEVVEPPKEEMTEIPKQPEAIEPPKENEEIQE